MNIIECIECKSIFRPLHPYQKLCSQDCKKIRKNRRSAEHYKIHYKLWRQNNIEKCKEKCRKWHADNKERIRAYERNRYRVSYKKKINNDKRRLVVMGIDGTFTESEWNLVLWLFSNRCAYCESEGTMTIDHVIPISKGGTGFIENILPACKSCNAKKNDRLDWEPAVTLLTEGGY